MARSQNPMDVHRRTQRKKELRKLKTERLQAREEKVKQSETVASVTKAIRELEKKQSRKNGNLDQHETKQLERLRKDLKLVKQAAEERPAEAPKVSAPTRPLTELDNPAKSVYYDAQMNPYGAPPPGKPRLYHKRGGGVTMDLKLAVVPGQEEEQEETKNLEPPPPPPPPPQQAIRDNRQGAVPPPPPPPPPPREPVQPPPPPPPPPPPKDPSLVPVLPPPSKSVKRSRKRKLDADIWASTEEVEYERSTNQLDLEEGATVTHAWVNAWYYKDSVGHIQGPFVTNEMHAWHQAGYFQPTTQVRNGELGNFTDNAKVNWDAQVNKASRMNGGGAPRDSVDDRIAALKQQDQESSVEDRIAALRNEGVQREETINDSAADRIAALRQQHSSQQEAQDASQTGVDEIEEVPPYDIGEAPVYDEEEEEVPVYYPEEREAPVYDEEEEEVPVYYPEEAGPEGYAQMPEENGNHDVPVYHPSDELVEPTGGAVSVPAGQNADASPSYPIQVETVESDNDESDYPVQSGAEDVAGADQQPPRYPIQEEAANDAISPYPADLEYPVTEAYPDAGDTYPVSEPYPTESEAYPVTDAYPGADDSVGAYALDEPVQPADSAFAAPPKKVYKGDKEVVGLVPSHLHKRRPPQPPQQQSKQSASAPNKAPAKKSSVTKDYDEFMKEINTLK